MDTISRGEVVGADLDRLIPRRAARRAAREGYKPSEELYEASCRVNAAKRAREMALAWWEFHDAQLRRHETTYGLLLAHHRQERDRYAALLEENPDGKE